MWLPSPCRSVDNTVPLLYLRRQAVSPVVTSGCPKRSEDGCPCRSVDNTVPLLYPRRHGGNMWRTFPPLTPVGTRASAAFQANQQAKRKGTTLSPPNPAQKILKI